MDTQFWEVFEGLVVDNKYHLRRLLGNGAYGGVFLTDEVLGGQSIGQVALKLIMPSAASRGAQLGELIAMRNLNHPHVVRGLAAGECVLNKISLLYLVMDVADGTLEQHLNRRTTSAADAKEIVQSIAKGLLFLHGKNMVHRDLKPGNVLCINGEWQLADFGLIRTFGSDSGTFTQTVAGTPVFMPPESFKGEVSPAWDVWSLGVLIVYAFTKQYPFTGASHHDIASAIMAKEPRIASPLPKPLDAIVRGCLIKDRRSRWTAQQVLSALNSPVVALPKAPTMQPTAKTIHAPATPPRQSTGAAGRWATFTGVAVGGIVIWNAIASNNRTPSVPPAPPARASHTSITAKYTATHPVHHSVRSARTVRHHHPTPLASVPVKIRHHAPSTAAMTAHAHAPRMFPAHPPHPTRIASNGAPPPRHYYFHHATRQPHSYRSSIGDLHSASSIGSGSLHSDSGSSSSGSSSISGGLH